MLATLMFILGAVLGYYFETIKTRLNHYLGRQTLIPDCVHDFEVTYTRIYLPYNESSGITHVNSVCTMCGKTKYEEKRGEFTEEQLNYHREQLEEQTVEERS